MVLEFRMEFYGIMRSGTGHDEHGTMKCSSPNKIITPNPAEV